MLLTRYNLYHPYTGSFLGANAENSSTSSTDTNIFIDDIHLYHQPVPSPMVASLFLVVNVVIFIVGTYLHLNVLKRLRKEDSILKDITKTFVYANMTLWTDVVIILNVTNFIHTLPEMITSYLCPIFRFTLYLCVNLVTFHSFVSAIMRYFFIVHTNKVDGYGKEKVKTVFYWLSIFIPLIITVWKLVDGSEVDSMSFINKCYGHHHKVFLIETSSLNIFKKNFCGVENYAELVGYDKLVAIGKQLFCVASMITMIIMGSNMTEGFIYYKLFSYLNR